MQCPNCNETLVMADRQGIEIDYCPKCRGVWLDRGELDKIVERSAGYTPTPDNTQHYNTHNPNQYYPDQRHGHHNDPYYGKKKKKGYLSDFFDFD